MHLSPPLALPLIVALCGLPFTSSAQTDDPLRDAESCFRAEVAALFTGSVWQSTGAGVTSMAEFKQNGQYAIAAYMGAPDGSPDMAFDGTWSIDGDVVSVTDTSESGCTGQTGTFRITWQGCDEVRVETVEDACAPRTTSTNGMTLRRR